MSVKVALRAAASKLRTIKRFYLKTNAWIVPAWCQLLELAGRKRKSILIFSISSALIIFLVQSLISAVGSSDAIRAAEINANKYIAHELAEKLEVVSYGDDLKRISEKLKELTSLNPSIEVYILDRRGKVLSSAIERDLKLPFIDLKPVKELLTFESHAGSVYGDDPATFRERKPVSVAPVRLSGFDGYLYAVLAVKQHGTALIFSSHFVPSMLRMTLASALLTLSALIIVACVAFLFIGTRIQAINHTLAGLSRDIKGPLARVQGYLETLMLKEGSLSTKERQEFLGIALKSAQSLTTLIDDLLQLTRIDSTDLRATSERFALADLVNDIVMQLAQKINEKHIRLEVDIPTNTPMIFADISLISRAVQNILDNAVRYTNIGGTVALKISPRGPRVMFSVRDTGIGIPKAELSNIGKQFFRATNARGYCLGTGLGLSIVKKVVERHQGKLQISSSQGEGTCIEIDLPTYKEPLVKAKPTTRLVRNGTKRLQEAQFEI